MVVAVREVLEVRGNPDLAEVYVARLREDPRTLVEFVDSIDPRFPREEKWVVTVSTQFGCPMRCAMCDSGDHYIGNLTADEILSEIDHVVKKRAPSGKIDCPKFKIQFARMGEPSLNPGVLEVLEKLPIVYDAPGLMPCIASIAPRAGKNWFEKLMEIKNRMYPGGRFQLQFSINTTSEDVRNRLMPASKWNFEQIAEYGERFHETSDRRITLNFVLAKNLPVDPKKVRSIFSPEHFIIKLTPLNPTDVARANNLMPTLTPSAPNAADDLAVEFENLDFDCIVSIGAEEEIRIGSNCGQAVARWRRLEAVESMQGTGVLSGARLD
ncbi:MAG: radical SAM protein [Deltaproteobacteria bacterium]|nr:radical SAM protein [Deltaproteobacteria bacterium]